MYNSQPPVELWEPVENSGFSSVTSWNSLGPSRKALCFIILEFGGRHRHIPDVFPDCWWLHSCLLGPASGIYSRDAQVLHRSGKTRLGQRKLQAHLVAWRYPMGKCPERRPHGRAKAEGEGFSDLSSLLLFHSESTTSVLGVPLLVLKSLKTHVWKSNLSPKEVWYCLIYSLSHSIASSL